MDRVAFDANDEIISKVVVADFAGTARNESQFAESVADQIARVVSTFHAARGVGVQTRRGEAGRLQVRRLRCPVESQEEAELLAARAGADVVIWGTAHINYNLPSTKVVSEITTGDISLQSEARISVGKIEIQSKPYTVVAHATLLTDHERLREIGAPLDVGSVGHLDFPRLDQTPAIRLVAFALGIHYLRSDQPWLAASMFLLAEPSLPPSDDRYPVLHGLVGYSLLFMPGSEDLAKAHLRVAASFADSEHQRANYVSNIGTALRRQGRAAFALQFFEEALKLDQHARPDDNEVLTQRFSDVGQEHYALHDYNKAIGFLQQALKLAILQYGAGSDEELYHSNQLARALHKSKRFQELIPLRKRALEIARKRHGAETINMLAPLQALAIAQHRAGDIDGAYRSLTQAVEVTEEANKPSAKARTLSILADLYYIDGRKTAALRTYRRSYDLSVGAHGRAQQVVATTLTKIANCQVELGEVEAALGSFREAIQIYKTDSRPELEGLATALTGLGRALAQSGSFDEAVNAHQEALMCLREVLDTEHPDLAPVLYNLAEVHAARGEHDEAIRNFERALELEAAAYGESINTAASLTGMANSYHATGRYEKARSHHARALRLQEEYSGRRSLEVAISLTNIGLSLHAQRKYGEAARKYRDALSVLDSLDEDAPRERSRTISNLALSYSGMNPPKRNRALRLYTSSLKILEEADADEQPDFATILNNRGHLLENMGKLAAALNDYQRALRLDRAIRAGLPAVARDHLNIAEVYLQMRKCGPASEAVIAAHKALAESEHHPQELATNLQHTETEVRKTCSGDR